MRVSEADRRPKCLTVGVGGGERGRGKGEAQRGFTEGSKRVQREGGTDQLFIVCGIYVVACGERGRGNGRSEWSWEREIGAWNVAGECREGMLAEQVVK